MTKRFIAALLATSLAMTSLTAAPARADAGEIARFVFGAGALLMLGQALSNRDRDRDRDRDRETVTRRNVEPDRRVHRHPRVQRRVVPSECLRISRRHDGDGPRRFFPRRCLANNMANFNRLPDQCERRIWTRNGRRTVFAARCLRRNGWVFG